MHNEQILIVDDEPAIREMVMMTLEMAGFESLQAADISEAHQQVVDHRPALILLDWMLPGDKSGVDFCRMLKNDEIQVVFNTTEGKQAIADSSTIRRTALRHNVFCTTTIAGALAVCEALEFGNNYSVYTIQDLHAGLH